MPRKINNTDLYLGKGDSRADCQDATPSERVFENGRGSLPLGTTHEEQLLAPLAHAESVVSIGRRAARSALEGVAETLMSLSLVEQAGRESRSANRNIRQR